MAEDYKMPKLNENNYDTGCIYSSCFIADCGGRTRVQIAND